MDIEKDLLIAGEFHPDFLDDEELDLWRIPPYFSEVQSVLDMTALGLEMVHKWLHRHSIVLHRIDSVVDLAIFISQNGQFI